MRSGPRLATLLLFGGGLLACGCRATWRDGERSELLGPSARDLRGLLVIVDNRALELNGAATSGTTLYGTVLRAWQVNHASPVTSNPEVEESPVASSMRRPGNGCPR